MGKKFDKLEHKIEAYYMKKGYSEKRADYIGHSTAGKVARERQANLSMHPERHLEMTGKKFGKKFKGIYI